MRVEWEKKRERGFDSIEIGCGKRASVAMGQVQKSKSKERIREKERREEKSRKREKELLRVFRHRTHSPKTAKTSSSSENKASPAAASL
jgi:hypothetical protein